MPVMGDPTSSLAGGAVGPSGTLTFLFTDIEDSSVLWERFPRLMPDALARHDGILREVIGRHRGHVFTTAGDGFGAAFAAAPEAVAAAVDGQRALSSESWPVPLIRGARPSPTDELRYVTRIREVVDQAEAFGQPSGLASAWCSLGTALRTAEPLEALALLERALDLCTPLEVDETSNTIRRALASQYTLLGRPLDSLTLMRPALARCLRTGARHEVGEALRYVVRALAEAGRPRVAAIVLGRVALDSDELERNYHDPPTLHARLRADLGVVELQARLGDGQVLPIVDVAQLVLDTIDELSNGTELTSRSTNCLTDNQVTGRGPQDDHHDAPH